MTVFIGVDPGMKGAVCIIDGSEIKIVDTPTLTKKTGKDDYDIGKMAALLKPFEGKNVLAVIEAVFSMTGQGVSSSFNFGRGKGLWEGICWAFGFEVQMVTPQSWKKAYDGLLVPQLSKETRLSMKKKDIEKHKRDGKRNAKLAARLLASKLQPDFAHLFAKVKDDGRAEALLIAHYAQTHHQSEIPK